MSLQLLTRYASFDADAFDGDAEARGQAGLTLLQRWTAVEGGGTWVLFQVNDQAKAAKWLGEAKSLGDGPADAHFLRTA